MRLPASPSRAMGYDENVEESPETAIAERGGHGANCQGRRACGSGHNVAMARILLGVTGGIAAYKACELVAAARQGRARRAPDRHARGRAVRPRARPSSRSRGRPPSDDPYPHLARADLLVIAPLTANTLAQARARARRRRPHRGGARAPRPGARRAGDEHAHVGAPGDAGERGDAARARRRARRARGGRARRGRARASAGWPSRRRSSRRVEELLGARAARSRASASSSPPAGRASRSTRCASSATARPGAWASRSPRRRAAAAPT